MGNIGKPVRVIEVRDRFEGCREPAPPPESTEAPPAAGRRDEVHLSR